LYTIKSKFRLKSVTRAVQGVYFVYQCHWMSEALRFFCTPIFPYASIQWCSITWNRGCLSQTFACCQVSSTAYLSCRRPLHASDSGGLWRM